jgi:autophagy-related protein 5
LSNTL